VFFLLAVLSKRILYVLFFPLVSITLDRGCPFYLVPEHCSSREIPGGNGLYMQSICHTVGLNESDNSWFDIRTQSIPSILWNSRLCTSISDASNFRPSFRFKNKLNRFVYFNCLICKRKFFSCWKFSSFLSLCVMSTWDGYRLFTNTASISREVEPASTPLRQPKPFLSCYIFTVLYRGNFSTSISN
jgi:hypothetical protein